MDTEEVEATFDEFKEQWMADVVRDSPSTVELGRRFAQKMITDYFNLAYESAFEDFHYCDGGGDGGIDIAYLERGSTPHGELSESSGATWYLVQSKYGKSFQGTSTLFDEGRKILDTLGRTGTQLSSLSSVAQNVVNILVEFRQQAGKQDRIKLLFVTEKSLTDVSSEKALDDLRAMGKNRFGSLLEVESISLENIYDQSITRDIPALVSVPIKGNLVQDGDLLAGLVSLPSMYDFLRVFKQKASDLDKLYEKNVRSFLRRRKVNAKIKATLYDEPEQFGLYNNGVTIVVKEFSQHNGIYILEEPFVVNGCQTTNTIFDTFSEKVNSGATGTQFSATEWYKQAEKGSVIVKIVRVASSNAPLLTKITTFTNTQNVISDKDFLALNPKLQKWVQNMKAHHIFIRNSKRQLGCAVSQAKKSAKRSEIHIGSVR